MSRVLFVDTRCLLIMMKLVTRQSKGEKFELVFLLIMVGEVAGVLILILIKLLFLQQILILLMSLLPPVLRPIMDRKLKPFFVGYILFVLPFYNIYSSNLKYV